MSIVIHHPTAPGHDELPRTSGTTHPPTRLLRTLRPAARLALRRRFDLTVRGAERVPGAGPLIVAANHIGFIDGPLLAAMTPRPLHALTKREMFTGPLGRFLAAVGQIPVSRYLPDPGAVRFALRVLRDGGALCIFPEGTRGGGELVSVEGGVGYLALVTGATVVPVAVLGTRLPGGTLDSVPARGSRFVVSYGQTMHFDAIGWPRSRADVRRAAEQVRLALVETMAEAKAATGMSLPGPMPGGEQE